MRIKVRGLPIIIANSLLALLQLIVFGLFFSDCLIAKAAQAKLAVINESLEIKDWFALGSGCKGKAGDIGDIRMNLEKNVRDPLLYEVIFSKGSYELDSFKSITRKPSFARECALRIAAYPPKGFRIADIKALSAVTISKDRGAMAGVKTRLLTAKGSLSEQVFNFDKNIIVKEKKLDLSLVPDSAGQAVLNEIPCDKPKIIGVDFQFTNEKESYMPKVKIKPSHDKLATMLIRLEKCRLNVKTENSQPKPMS